MTRGLGTGTAATGKRTDAVNTTPEHWEEAFYDRLEIFADRCKSFMGNEWTGGGRGEGVAGVDPAGFHAALEPLHALGGGAVGEGLGLHVAGGHLLQAIVADRSETQWRFVTLDSAPRHSISVPRTRFRGATLRKTARRSIAPTAMARAALR